MKRDFPLVHPRLFPGLAALLLTTLPTPLLAEHSTPEETRVAGVQTTAELSLAIEPAELPVLDTADLLKRVPSAWQDRVAIFTWPPRCTGNGGIC
ncbi:hypothetical protein [Porticoccus sp.]